MLFDVTKMPIDICSNYKKYPRSFASCDPLLLIASSLASLLSCRGYIYLGGSVFYFNYRFKNIYFIKIYHNFT